MLPYKTIIKLHRNINQSLFLQLGNQIIQLIKQGILLPNNKLPSSRILSTTLEIHRKTVIAAYDELILQGWIVTLPKKGTFVNANIPLLQQQTFADKKNYIEIKKTAFSYYKNNNLSVKGKEQENGIMYLNDGVSDTRLTPIKEIANLYKSKATSKYFYKEIGYKSPLGNTELRITLAKYLNNTRGLKITEKNILITRGSQMGIYLSSKLLLNSNDVIAVGETNYASADETFIAAKAEILRIKVDAYGLDTTHLQQLCEKIEAQRKLKNNPTNSNNTTNIKAVYITPHHHHPTTVTLSAERRMHLLNLAHTYGFAIIEDDYDYDFHYNHAPILPLASHDINGSVIYIGSFCKTVAPVFRIGYLIAAEEFVMEASKQRGYLDRQGDALLELTFSQFIQNGALDRHINKTMKIYKKRRDFCCNLLQTELNEFFTFKIPTGGMAIWLQLDKRYNWAEISKNARIEKLEIGDWKRYDLQNQKHNCIRFGFSTFNKEEIQQVIEKLKKALQKAKNDFNQPL